MSHRATTWAWEVSAKAPSAPSLLVLLKLADMARDSGKAWPSHTYLADNLPLSPRTIRSSVQALADAGLLRKEPREGKSDVLWLNLSPVTIYPTGADDDDLFEGGKQRGRPRKTSANSAATPDKTPAGRADEPIEPDEPMGVDMRAPDPFEVWYAIYPRKVAKPEARKAFWKAATKLPFEELCTATRRFVDEVRGRDRDKVPHPATWLNQERWTDEPDANRSQTDGQSTRPAGGTDRAAERADARVQAMVDGARQALTGGRRRWTLG